MSHSNSNSSNSNSLVATVLAFCPKHIKAESKKQKAKIRHGKQKHEAKSNKQKAEARESRKQEAKTAKAEKGKQKARSKKQKARSKNQQAEPERRAVGTTHDQEPQKQKKKSQKETNKIPIKKIGPQVLYCCLARHQRCFCRMGQNVSAKTSRMRRPYFRQNLG